jgi:hypothetical protein
MPELLDKPQKDKFKYPGVFDRSAKKTEDVVVETCSDKEVIEEKPKRAPRKKKETEEVSATGRKQLKLGKIKG